METTLDRYLDYFGSALVGLVVAAFPAWIIAAGMNLFSEFASLRSIFVATMVATVIGLSVFAFTYKWANGSFPPATGTFISGIGTVLTCIGLARLAALTEVTAIEAIIVLVFVILTAGFVPIEMDGRL